MHELKSKTTITQNSQYDFKTEKDLFTVAPSPYTATRNYRRKKREVPFQEVLDQMKERDTKVNIRNIKDEIKKIDISCGSAKNMSSVTQIEQKCQEFA